MLTLAIGDLYIPERAINIPLKFKKLLSPNPNSIPMNNKISQVVCLGNVTNSYETLKFLYNLSPSFNMVRGEFDDPEILQQELLSLSNVDSHIPPYQIIVHEGLKIGYTNGYQIVPKNDPLSLSALARELDIDVLVWGGTHKVEAYTLDGKFFVNPGSATGAYSFDWPDNDDDEENNEDENDQENIQDKETIIEESKNEVKDEIPDIEKSDKGVTQEDKKNAGNEEPTEITEDDIDEAIESTRCIPSFCLLDTQGTTCTLYIYTYINEEVKVDKVTYQKE